jgi:hypothetical protein
MADDLVPLTGRGVFAHDEPGGGSFAPASPPLFPALPCPREPLTPGQRALYAAAAADTEAVFALDGMTPSLQDKVITAAIVAGRVVPEQAREELLAYVAERKTVLGFIDSRPWAVR